MKKFMKQYSISIGLLIFAVFNLVDHYIIINEYIAIPVLLIAITFMISGAVYHGGCLRKRKSSNKS